MPIRIKLIFHENFYYSIAVSDTQTFPTGNETTEPELGQGIEEEGERFNTFPYVIAAVVGIFVIFVIVTSIYIKYKKHAAQPSRNLWNGGNQSDIPAENHLIIEPSVPLAPLAPSAPTFPSGTETVKHFTLAGLIVLVLKCFCNHTPLTVFVYLYLSVFLITHL